MLNKAIKIMFLGVLAFSLMGMGFGEHPDNATAYKKLSASQAKALMTDEEHYILLDVRTEEEFRERHIKGAILLPYTEIKNRAAFELSDKDALILIYCRSGRRSAIAAKELIGMGYTQVYDFGGINDWPYETASSADNSQQ
jgi:phage shock protein E